MHNDDELQSNTSSEPANETAILDRIVQLEELVDRLSGRLFYSSAVGGFDEELLPAGQDRFVKATADGWLEVMVNGRRTPLPSGLAVTLTSSAGGRDFATVKEGVLAGTAFDVLSGNLDANYRRIDNLELTVSKRAGPPVVVGPAKYDLEIKIRYSEGGVVKTAGPFAAMTDASNPVPPGRHDVEIADFPHNLGRPYGPYGMVWFRLDHSGDRYLHPGTISEGCLTCAAAGWNEIYRIVHCARKDRTSVGAAVMP